MNNGVAGAPIPISFSQWTPTTLCVGLIAIETLQKEYSRFEFSEISVNECARHDGTFRGSIDNYERYSFGLLSIVNVEDVLGERDRIGFFLKKNLFLLVDVEDRDGSTGAMFEDVCRQIKLPGLTLEKFISAFFSRLLYRDFSAAEKMEFEIAGLEEKVGSIEHPKAFNAELLNRKKQLLVLRNYYEQLVDIGEELQENENELFDDNGLRYFKLFTDRVSRLSANVQILRESLVQIREAYDSSIDLSLNNTMKVFTVITSVFLPLSLIAGWYGMNFSGMPELIWEYGYPSVILLSLLVVLLCLWIFRRKKFL